VGGSFEHGNKTSGFIKYYELLEWLSDWRLLLKGSAPWIYLVTYVPWIHKIFLAWGTLRMKKRII
jgi:hypothetical protein